MKAKTKKAHETVKWLQRLRRMRVIMRYNKEFHVKKMDNKVKMANAMTNFLLALFMHRCKEAKAQITLFD